MRSRRKLLLGVFFLIVALSGFVAFSENVSAANTCSSTDQIIFKISADTNAHGEVWNGTGGYTTQICYDQIFGESGDGNRACSGTNKVIGLSADTNAHAEDPALTNYLTDVCYGDLDCNAKSTDCIAGEFLVASLSTNTNAHIANDLSYPVNLCCSIGVVQECVGIVSCGSYATESECAGNSCQVAAAGAPSGIDCSDPNINCFCAWDSVESECNSVSNITSGGVCGNDIIETSTTETGEECDGNDWGAITGCGFFDNFTGGTLDCYAQGTSDECTFDTSLCTPINPGICGNGVVNNNETCDGNDWGSITGCENFGLTDGNLDCDSSCQFDTSQCIGSSTFNVGQCISREQTGDICEDDGFLTFSWTANWVWDTLNVNQLDPQSRKVNCVSGQRTVECPASILLPFFGFYNIISVMILISLIYLVMSIRRSK